jgi:hypothetical protein
MFIRIIYQEEEKKRLREFNWPIFFLYKSPEGLKNRWIRDPTHM